MYQNTGAYGNVERIVTYHSAAAAPQYTASPLEQMAEPVYSATSITDRSTDVYAFTDYTEKAQPYEEPLKEEIEEVPIQQYIFAPTQFLLPNRPTTPVIKCDSEILAYIEEAFQATTGKEFPKNISLKICSPEEMQQHQGGVGRVLGFAINRHPFISNIVVQQAPLDELMLTIGHEIGHVLSTPREHIVEEEAKAFSFSFWWMETIKKENIGNLAHSFPSIIPAPNGIHDTAHKLVHDLHQQGMSFQQIFETLANGKTLEQRL